MTQNDNAKEIMLGAVFLCFCRIECGSYETMYSPQRVVLSTREIAERLKWTQYCAKKAINELVSRGWIERASCGCPAVVSWGEYPELVCESRPPINGYAITKKGFETDLWKMAYFDWQESMRKWCDGEVAENDD